MTAACRVNQLMAYFILRFTFRQALMQLSPDLCNTVAPVIGPVRGLARLVAVPRIAAPATNPEPRLGKIILLPAAPTDAALEARPAVVFPCVSHSDAVRISCGDSLEAKIIVKLELEPACRVQEPQT